MLSISVSMHMSTQFVHFSNETVMVEYELTLFFVEKSTKSTKTDITNSQLVNHRNIFVSVEYECESMKTKYILNLGHQPISRLDARSVGNCFSLIKIYKIFFF